MRCTSCNKKADYVCFGHSVCSKHFIGVMGKKPPLPSPEHQSQEYMKECIPKYYGDRVCKRCGKEIPYGVKECPCEKKPQEIELLREISSDMADFDDVYDNRVAINEIIRFIQDENR